MFKSSFFGARHWAARFFGANGNLQPETPARPGSGGGAGSFEYTPYITEPETKPDPIDLIVADNDFFLLFQ
jgi:hypothetical protein